MVILNNNICTHLYVCMYVCISPREWFSWKSFKFQSKCIHFLDCLAFKNNRLWTPRQSKNRWDVNLGNFFTFFLFRTAHSPTFEEKSFLVVVLVSSLWMCAQIKAVEFSKSKSSAYVRMHVCITALTDNLEIHESCW